MSAATSRRSALRGTAAAGLGAILGAHKAFASSPVSAADRAILAACERFRDFDLAYEQHLKRVVTLEDEKRYEPETLVFMHRLDDMRGEFLDMINNYPAVHFSQPLILALARLSAAEDCGDRIGSFSETVAWTIVADLAERKEALT